jgi:pimeloyl-ACP methyl ester carboxylesterase
MKLDAFSQKKRFVQVGENRLAYFEEGSGAPLLLLHGCPFSSFVWRKVIPLLSGGFCCLAPDLLGLGDTETPDNGDWSLRSQTNAVLGFLDSLHIGKCHVLGHDHGGAVAQLLASEHAERIDRLILANSEAYDNWPSSEERPFARLTQVPLLGDLALWLWSRKTCLRWTLAQARAVYQPQVLTDELLAGYIRANLSDRKRRKKLGRFIAMQFEPSNNRTTLDLLPDLRQFDHPTLLVWAQDDPHFGPQWGQRLCNDIPGAKRLDILPATGHLLMEERPDEFEARVRSFLNERFGEEQHRGKCN